MINDYISARGTSGSSRASRALTDALQSHYNVEVVSPSHLPHTTLAKAVHMAAWDFLGAPNSARRMGGEVLIHAANTGGRARTGRTVLVMYDTMVLDHPALFSRNFVQYARLAYPKSIAASDLIVTCSLHSAERINSRWPARKVVVIPLPGSFAGTECCGTRRPDDDPRMRLKVLMVSSADRHKRLPLGVRAVSLLRQQHTAMTLTLVVRGGNGMDEVTSVVRALDPRREWIELKTGIDDRELGKLYDDSLCLMVPSLDEGYCLPAIEATQHELPVIHLNRGALPEVVPRPALGCVRGEELELASLVDQLEQLVADPDIGSAWVAAAQVVAKRATWAEYSRNWVGVLQSLGMTPTNGRPDRQRL